MKIAIALAAAALGATAAAAYAPDTSFVKAGYIVQVRDEGSRLLLTGRNPSTKATFKLSVSRDQHVTGVWNGQPVDMVVGAAPKAETIALAQ